MRDTKRERQRHRQRERQAPCREPDVGLDPGTPGSRPGLKADAQLLSHPGIPIIFSYCSAFDYPVYPAYLKKNSAYFSIHTILCYYFNLLGLFIANEAPKSELRCMCMYVLHDLVSKRRDHSFHSLHELVRFNQRSRITKMDICVFVSVYVCEQRMD